MQIRKKGNRRGKPKKEENKPPRYPNSLVLYDPETLIGELFLTTEDIEKALASGEWIKFPFMKLEDWLKKRAESEDEEEEEHVNHSEKLRFRDANLPIQPSSLKRYVSQMNVKELIQRGIEVGLYFGKPENCPTKREMQRKIKAVEDKKT